MPRLMVFSTLYLILASVGPVMGFYVLRLHPRGTANRLFLVISLCLTLWALGRSIVVVAPDEATSVFWTRVAALGHGVIYSALLHFALISTDPPKCFHKKWIYPVLYLPAAVSVFAFSLSPGITGAIYDFESTERGWMRATGLTWFDAFFHVYYIGAVLASLLVIWRWKRVANKPEVTKQANILLAASMTAFILGTLTDTLGGQCFHLPFPELAPIFFAIPLLAVSYCIRYHRFMKSPNPDRSTPALDDNLRAAVFRLASVGLVLAGITLYALEFFWWRLDRLELIAFTSTLLAAAGCAVFFSRRSPRGLARLEGLILFASMAIIPIHTISVLQTGGLAVWSFPLVITIFALVFNSDVMLISSSVSLLFSQIYLGSVAPRLTITLDYRTYASRTIMLVFILVTAYFVHRVYVRRLKGNAAQARTQALLSGIVSGFSLADRENAAGMMRGLLSELTDYFSAKAELVSIADNEFCDLLGMQSYCADGSEVTPDRRSLCIARWEESQREHRAEGPNAPCEHEAVAGQSGGDRRGRWIFIPVLKRETPVAFFHIENPADGPDWTRDQLGTLPVISRIVSDALEKLSSEMHIKFMAYYDALTHLPNRQLFHDRAEQAIHLARRNDKLLAILFLDLDFFKSINDTMGHEGGDMLIQAISQKLSAVLRKTDTIARFGGDEFLILLSDLQDLEDVILVADKIMDVFKKPTLLKGQEVFTTASAGISVFPADGEDAQALIKHADIAMYMAKDKGKNQYAFCSGSMKELVQYRVNLTNHLYRALERGEMTVYYQPQIDLKTEKITGIEALLRWFHPDYGLIPPMEFISIAEQTGLINSIGAWVLETACRQTAAWKRMGLGNLRVAANLSVVQLRNPGLVRQVEHIIAATGIDPQQVELEITESTTAREPDYIIRVLGDLKRLGVSISIDDFGIEYSSLNRLKTLPVDRLKMDIQFVHGIDKSAKDQAIAMVIIGLAQNLNLKLVAEGVENNTQLDFLRSKMCDEVQGYYFFKPMPAEDIEKVLRSHQNVPVSLSRF